MTIGIYKLYFEHPDSKVYIGSSMNIERRFIHHNSELLRGTHHSIKLQKDFDDFKLELKYEVFVQCTPSYFNEYELATIEEFDSIENGYNSSFIPRRTIVEYGADDFEITLHKTDIDLGLRCGELILYKYLQFMQEKHKGYVLERQDTLQMKLNIPTRTLQKYLTNLRLNGMITL